MKVIDLFAGCGGFSTGFKQANYEIIKAVEFDKNIAKSYKYNHPETIIYNDDIKNLDNNKYFFKNEADIIIGGPPCQGFSMAGFRIRNGFIDDERNYLFKHYFNIVKLVKPKVFVMENVKGLLNIKNGQIYSEIKKCFSNKEELNGDIYNLEVNVINAVDYGLPQNRERVIIIGTLNKKIDLDKIIEKTKKEIELKNKDFFKKYNIYEVIGNLPKPTEKGECIINVEKSSNYEKNLANEKGITYNHIKTNHSPKAINRIQQINQGENFKKLKENIKSVHSGAYGRLDGNGIAMTITTRFDTPSAGRFIHPIEDRTITPREAARIQGFPDSFKFMGSKSSICKQIGNAVPIKVAYFYGEVVRRIMNEYFNK